MSTRMHLLLQVDPGHASDVAEYVAALPGVLDTAQTSGPYDVIATVTGSVQDLQQCLARVRRVPGLAVLRTCAAAPAPVAATA